MVAINFKCVPFTQLTVPQLYSVLRLRADVFILEQECVYQDIDGHDADAYHVLGFDRDRELVAYSRLLPAGSPISHYEYPAIGRVIISKKVRRKGVGTKLMEESIRQCERLFGDSTGIKISAQVYIDKFYAALGFRPVGKQYIEDGIPHVCMIRMR